MAEFSQEIGPGDIENKIVNIVVEIPFGSTDKIEWSPITNKFEIDRVESVGFPEPTNYGFIPKTVGGDGDNLDAFIVQDKAIPSGTVVSARLIGVMLFMDEGEVDDKVVAVPLSGSESVLSLSDLPKQKIKEIEYHFNHYKDYKQPGSTSVIGWGGLAEAKAITIDAIKRCNN